MRRSKPKSEALVSDVRSAMRRALDLLSRREHSAVELQSKLRAKGFEATHIDAALAALVDKGLLDDNRFVESYARSRINRGYGPLRIRAELRDRGAEPASDEWFSDDEPVDWFELASNAREKRFGPAKPQDYKEQARQMRFLQQRGFTSEQIRAAVRPPE